MSTIYKQCPILAIVVPCYNESEVLGETAKRLQYLLQELTQQQIINVNSYIFFVDDGSRDDTWAKISHYNQTNTQYKGLKLSRNFGHQNALLGGLHHVSDADIIISIDADLQDDINAIKKMIVKYKLGFDVVYGVRSTRNTDTFFKKNTAQLFYKFLKLMGVETVYNHADYRLMSKRALQTFLNLPEKNLYLRGMVPLIGYKHTQVHYVRNERFAGESKYNFTQMLSLAWNGISSMSIKPLRFVTFCGFFFFGVSILLSFYALHAYITDSAIAGWFSIVLPIYFLGGVQLLCIGLLGEYIAKIYKEVKQRPRFIVEEKLD